MVTRVRPSNDELVELHFHLGQSVEPHVLWAIAHEQGIRLSTKDYWEFYDLVTLNKPDVTWEDYHKLFHLTELVQSSPVAMEQTVYQVVSGAYRVNNITLMEPGFNPLFRNRSGERDLDAIILAALRGMERALLEFPVVRAGIIIMLDRRQPKEFNAIAVKKAIKYRTRGIVGIDMAGPRGGEPFDYAEYADLYAEARDAGLKTTVHTGEDGDAEEMAYVLKHLPLDRVNHGFKAYTDPALMDEVAKRNLCCCICPTSSLRLGFFQNEGHMKEIFRTLLDHGVKLCVNTDNPSMLNTNIRKELDLVRQCGALSDEEIARTMQWAREASFIPTMPGRNLYL